MKTKLSRALKGLLFAFIIFAGCLLPASGVSADYYDTYCITAGDCATYDPADSCSTNTNPAATTDPASAGMTGNIPAGGEDVGASEFTDSQGYHGDNLDGTYSYAELSPPGTAAKDVSQQTATALGGLAYQQKLAITYNGKTVVAEKLDVGQGGSDVNGDSRDIDLHFNKTAQALGITNASTWTGVVHVQAVVDSTSLGPVSDPSSLVDSSSNSDVASPDQSGDCCSSGASDTLVGNDPEQQVWNFFKAKGLSDAQTAGIMGNMEQESSFDPERMQIGGDSKNPLDAKDEGWGLIQWSGNGNNGHSTADKFYSLFRQSGVTGPIYELSTQLNLVWQHLNNHPVVTAPFDLTHFETLTSASDAATYFESQIEGGTDPGGVRETNAENILKDTSITSGTGQGDTAASSDGCSSGVSAAVSPDCTAPTGDVKLLCAARKYDPVDYVWGGGHSGGPAYHSACPTIKANDSSCGLDCSGLVSVAVYDAFGNSRSWDTDSPNGGGISTDQTNWQQINSLSDVQPGDVMEPDPGHVEIVDHVVGNTIYTFGAHTDKTDQPDQVGPTNYPATDQTTYFRYIGQGSSS